jgi:hypothetical protein
MGLRTRYSTTSTAGDIRADEEGSMKIQPVEFTWLEVYVVDENGEMIQRKAMVPARRFDNLCGRQFEDGSRHTMAPVESRSMNSHRHYFAALKAGFQNLPEKIAARWPTPEHLRAWLLIETGWYDEHQIECESDTYAKRLATFVRSESPYARIAIRGTMVIIMKAKSQSLSEMTAQDFQKSKTEVLDLLEHMIGTDRGALMREAKGHAKPRFNVIEGGRR